MAIPYQPLVTDGLAKQIAESIRLAIVSGQLKVDERLPTEEELASRFGVSRPTIREALKRLAAQNLIRSRRGPTGGTFVKRPSQEEVAQVLSSATTLLASMGEFDLAGIAEARQELELVCSRLAAQRRDDDNLAAIAAEIEAQKDAALTDVEFCASDVRLHHAVAEATKNPVLRLVMVGVIEALQPVANMVVFRFRERRQIVRQHERLYDAIRRHDADAAAAAVVEQMTYLRTVYGRAQDWRQERDGT